MSVGRGDHHQPPGAWTRLTAPRLLGYMTEPEPACQFFQPRLCRLIFRVAMGRQKLQGARNARNAVRHLVRVPYPLSKTPLCAHLIIIRMTTTAAKRGTGTETMTFS